MGTLRDRLAKALPAALVLQIVVTAFTYVPGDEAGKFGGPIPIGDSLNILFGGMTGADGLIALVLFAVNVALTAVVLAVLGLKVGPLSSRWLVAGALGSVIVIIGSYVLLSLRILPFAGLPIPFAFRPLGRVVLLAVWLDALATAWVAMLAGRVRRPRSVEPGR